MVIVFEYEALTSEQVWKLENSWNAESIFAAPDILISEEAKRIYVLVNSGLRDLWGLHEVRSRINSFEIKGLKEVRV